MEKTKHIDMIIDNRSLNNVLKYKIYIFICLINWKY